MILHIISILSLLAPLIWELVNDSKGDFNKSEDVFVRILIGLVASLIGFVLIEKEILDSFLLSMAIHFAFFDYLIAYILIKNRTIEPPRGETYHWFSYVAKEGVVDNFKIWRKMDPKKKLWVRGGVLIAALLIFFLR